MIKTIIKQVSLCIILLGIYSCTDLHIGGYDEIIEEDLDYRCICFDMFIDDFDQGDFDGLDTDQDCIADAIENEPQNSSHQYEVTDDYCDMPFSVSQGTPNDGSIIWATCNPLGQATLTNVCYECTEGIDAEDGFYNYHGSDPISRDHWAIPALQNGLLRAARLQNLSGLKIMKVGDMSLEYGGPFTRHGNPNIKDHASHQSGLDVDIRYMRLNGDGPIDIANEPYQYDRDETLLLIVNIIEELDVDRIFVSVSDNLDFDNDDLSYVMGRQINVLSHDASGVHDNHFHVRIKKPNKYQ